MGRRIATGTVPITDGGLQLRDNNITPLGANTNLLLSPTGTGVVRVESGYISRGQFNDNTLVPKVYVDNIITPGLLFISFD